METGGSEWPFRISRSSRNLLDATKISNELQSSRYHQSWRSKAYHFVYRYFYVYPLLSDLRKRGFKLMLLHHDLLRPWPIRICNTYCLIFTDFHPLAVGVLSGSNDYVIDGSTKIKNYHKEEVDAQCQVEDDKLVLTITGGKAGTVKITRLIKDDKLHVEQVIFNSHWSQGQPSCQKLKKNILGNPREKSLSAARLRKVKLKKTILQSVAGIDCRTHIRPLSFAVRRSLFLSQIHHGASTYNTNYN